MKLFKKFPSYDYLLQGAAISFRRFPFTLLSAIFGTVILIALIQLEKGSQHFTLQKLVFSAALGLPLFTALGVWAEKRQINWGVAIQAIGFMPIILYYLSLPPEPLTPYMYPIRFILLIVAFHLLVAYLPFIGGQLQGFWQYNKSLFIRFLISALYSAVMYVGLLIALIAAKELFGVDVPDKRFLQLWVVIAGIFNTWVFLAGIPNNLSELSEVGQYPDGLKIFTQYILLPLVGLYLVILYAYELKIIIAWNWPKGWVSQLVLWYSVVGILSMLLLWPLREGNRWVRIFTRWFFRALIPLVVMLFLAISERVSVYGITTNRYLVFSMAIGLAILTLYFVFGKKKDIRAIPAVICIIALLASIGPWSAFTVSKHSQQSRLEKLLIQNKIFVNGAIKPASPGISFDAQKEMSSVVAYLLEWHGKSSFSPWIADSTIKSFTSESTYSLRDTISQALGFEYVGSWKAELNGGQFRFELASDAVNSISGYDHLIRYSIYPFSDSIEAAKKYIIENDTCFISFCSKPPIIFIRFKPNSMGSEDSVEIPLNDSIVSFSKTQRDNNIDAGQLTFEKSVGNYKTQTIIRDVSGLNDHDSIKVDNLNAYVLIRKNH
jgi:hypothetical protein